MATTNVIEVYRSNTDLISVSVKDGSGVAFALTGYDCLLVVKESKDTETVILSVTATPDVTVTNLVEFPLTSDETDIASKDYWYEVVISNSPVTLKKTVLQDIFRVLDSLDD